MSTPYATVVELTDYLDIQGTDSDALLEARIEAASRAVDGWCGRVFYTTEEPRVFTAADHRVLSVPDLLEVASLEIDSAGDRTYATSWDAADYDLEPLSGPPYASVWTVGSRAFPLHRRGVRITGTWGYSETIPAAVREATLLQASRLYKRKDAPFGVAGSVEHGQLQTITSIDPDVKQLLAPYRRQSVEVV